MLRRIKNGVAYLRFLGRIRLAGGCEKQQEGLVLFDTAIGSANMGDHIIRHYCSRVIREVFPGKEPCRVPTHLLPEPEQLARIRTADTKIVCGTNLMTPHYEEYSNWKMPGDLKGYRNIVTLGVGWGRYCPDISRWSRAVYRTILSSKGLHSVRDSYTEQKFHEMGIHNVINTGCPTLWALTPDHCAGIPAEKGKRVVTTITDYDRDPQRDREMLEILLRCYAEVSVWIQGTEDEAYLDMLDPECRLQRIPRSLEAYEQALSQPETDFVGTRLHAGIHALNYRRRTIIIAIDNRALEMGADVRLPILPRENVDSKLEEMISRPLPVEIRLPEENIRTWKAQF